jgi:hypothetical protein
VKQQINAETFIISLSHSMKQCSTSVGATSANTTTVANKFFSDDEVEIVKIANDSSAKCKY